MSREGVFWGWGEAGAGPSLPDHAAGFLRSALGVEGAVVSRPVALDGGAAARLRRCRARCGRGSRGSWGRRTCATTRRRAPAAAAASPTSTCCASARATARTRRTPSWRRATRSEAQQVIYACSEEGVAVVPYGGGTSVVGGLEPLRGRYGALISLDLGPAGGAGVVRRALAHRVAARRDAAAGGRPRARRSTASRSPTRRRATSGRRSAAASRRARRASPRPATGGSRTTWWRCAARRRSGELATLAVPATAAGPSLKRLVIGSEGTLGVITSVGLRVFPLPAAQRYEGWFVHSFAEGADALRQLVQAGLAPDVARLSDEARDEDGAGAGRRRRAQGPGRPGAAAHARLRGGLPGDLRLGGRRRGDRAPPRPRRRGC